MRLFDTIPQTGAVTQALRQASAQTGVGFDYLLHTAIRESGLDATAEAKGSSASGLFQFIESTWLETLKRTGASFGLGHLADRIERTADGRYEVSDDAAREEILSLRQDPETAALMAAALTKRNAAQVAAAIGRQPTGGELYIAHFLGAGDAARLIALAADDPDADATQAFPRAARANPGIFQARDGTARTVSQVYTALTRKHSGPATAIAENVRRIESRVAGFFSSLFRATGEEAVATAGKAERATGASRPSPRPEEVGDPLVLADFARPRLGGVPLRLAGDADASAPLFVERQPASERLTAHGAYDTQVRWFATLYRS